MRLEIPHDISVQTIMIFPQKYLTFQISVYCLLTPVCSSKFMPQWCTINYIITEVNPRCLLISEHEGGLEKNRDALSD